MVGNVWEWTAADANAVDAPVRGGSYIQPPEMLHTWLQSIDRKDSVKAVLGFRCRL
jgi:formylglycine-generating enzyme required for sulfatase activity